MFTTYRQEVLPEFLAWSTALFVVLSIVLVIATWMAGSGAWQRHAFSRAGGEEQADHGRLWSIRYAVLEYLKRDGDSLMRDNRMSYRERSHLREIKRILGFAGTCTYSLIMVWAAALVWFVMVGGLSTARIVIGRFLLRFGFCSLLLSIAGVAGVWSFDISFVWLHRALFEGRNWLLPNASLLYRAFPPAFFEYSLASLAWAASALGTVTMVVGLLIRRGPGQGSQDIRF